MNRRWIAAGLGLFTIAGGHFYNRRPHKAFLYLFMAVLLQWLVNIIATWFWVADADPMDQIMNTIIGSTIVLAGVIVVSTVDSFRDAGHLPDSEGKMIVVSAMSLGSIGGLALILLTIVSAYAVLGPDTRAMFSSSGSSDEESFTQHLFPMGAEYCIAQDCYQTSVRSKLPEGDAMLSGKLVIDGQPAQKAEVSFLTADGQTTVVTVTDGAGQYRIALPVGSYDLIKTKIKAALNGSPYSYTAVTGSERKLDMGRSMNGNEYLPAQPIRIDVAAGETATLDLALHAPPRLRAPVYLGKQEVTKDDIKLEWTPVRGASVYGIGISRVEIISSGHTRQIPLAKLQSHDTVIALETVLEELPEDEEASQYSVAILAFDESGRFIAENQSYSDEIELPEGWKIRQQIPESPCCRKAASD